MGNRKIILFTIVMPLLLSACSFGGDRDVHASNVSRKAEFNSVDVTGANFAKELSLRSVRTGNMVHLSDYLGKVLIVYFGFTGCQSECPVAMSEWKAVFHALGKDSSQLQLLFVTVDPERDSPSVLKKYITSFGESNFDALYGSLPEIHKVAKEFHIYFDSMPMRKKELTNTNHRMMSHNNHNMMVMPRTIDHTAVSYVYDKKLGLRLLVKNGQIAPDKIIGDIRKILAGL
ncbi:SCO family protein [Candidatus Ichthyocystis sparus]|nr:SCO family protein [Candidatus Ichthyocystis sparus]